MKLITFTYQTITRIGAVVDTQVVLPNAKIPTALFPAAELWVEATVAAPPALTAQPE